MQAFASAQKFPFFVHDNCVILIIEEKKPILYILTRSLFLFSVAMNFKPFFRQNALHICEYNMWKEKNKTWACRLPLGTILCVCKRTYEQIRPFRNATIWWLRLQSLPFNFHHEPRLTTSSLHTLSHFLHAYYCVITCWKINFLLWYNFMSPPISYRWDLSSKNPINKYYTPYIDTLFVFVSLFSR